MCYLYIYIFINVNALSYTIDLYVFASMKKKCVYMCIFYKVEWCARPIVWCVYDGESLRRWLYICACAFGDLICWNIIYVFRCGGCFFSYFVFFVYTTHVSVFSFHRMEYWNIRNFFIRAYSGCDADNNFEKRILLYVRMCRSKARFVHF